MSGPAIWYFDIHRGSTLRWVKRKADKDFELLQSSPASVITSALLVDSESDKIILMTDILAQKITRAFTRVEEIFWSAGHPPRKVRIPAFEYISTDGSTEFCFASEGRVLITKDPNLFIGVMEWNSPKD